VHRLKEFDETRFRQVCGAIPEDGANVTIGENDNPVVRKVAASDHAVGIFRREELHRMFPSVLTQGSAPDKTVIYA
jgi:hypothetical protein